VGFVNGTVHGILAILRAKMSLSPPESTFLVLLERAVKLGCSGVFLMVMSKSLLHYGLHLLANDSSYFVLFLHALCGDECTFCLGEGRLTMICRGGATSAVLRESLVPYVSRSLSQLFQSPSGVQGISKTKREKAVIDAIKAAFNQVSPNFSGFYFPFCCGPRGCRNVQQLVENFTPKIYPKEVC
jgi:hypothetical protein